MNLLKSLLEIPDTRAFHEDTIWSPDIRYIIFLSESNGRFYKLDIQTGEASDISGVHSVESWVISRVATSP